MLLSTRSTFLFFIETLVETARRAVSTLAPPTFPFPRGTALRVLGFVAVMALSFFDAAVWPAPAPGSGPTTVECNLVSSAVLGRAVRYCVALPADYASAKGTRYRTLYFLHGLFEDETSWSRRGGQQVLDQLLGQGQVGQFLVVLPDGGRTFYVDSFDGRERYEDFFIQEFIPWIDRTYRTIAQPAARGISGTSMGGYGALHLAMSHPDVFGSASAHSAALLAKFPNPLPSEGRWAFYARVLEGPFGSPLSQAYWEANSPLTLAEHPQRFAGLNLYFDCGDKDRYGFEEGAQLLDRALAAKGFPHEFALRPGGHGWEYLNQYMKYSLLFHWRWFGKAGDTLTAHGAKATGREP